MLVGNQNRYVRFVAFCFFSHLHPLPSWKTLKNKNCIFNSQKIKKNIVYYCSEIQSVAFNVPKAYTRQLINRIPKELTYNITFTIHFLYYIHLNNEYASRNDGWIKSLITLRQGVGEQRERENYTQYKNKKKVEIFAQKICARRA